MIPESNGKVVVTVDGRAFCRKKEFAQALADRLRYIWLDYETVLSVFAVQKLWLMRENGDESVTNMGVLNTFNLEYEFAAGGMPKFKAWGREVNSWLNAIEVVGMAKQCGKDETVKSALEEFIRRQAFVTDIVVTGHDVGRRVFPDANVKLFVDCSLEERAKRFQAELASEGKNIDSETLTGDIIYMDNEACIDPAEDAIIMQNTATPTEELMPIAVGVVKSRLGS